MPYIVIDFETRSACDLKKHGLMRYAKHPTTDVLCMALYPEKYREPVIYIHPEFLSKIDFWNIKYPILGLLSAVELVKDHDIVVAQNSMFEYVLWNEVLVKKHGVSELSLHKMHDTKAQLAYCGLPLNLEDAALALRLTEQKDMTGHKAMLKCCKPRNALKREKEANPNWENEVYWHVKQKDLELNFNYCCQDVITEKAVYDTLPKLPKYERNIWCCDQVINLRGVPIDVDGARDIVRTTEQHKTLLEEEFSRLTNGGVSSPRSYVALKNWVNANSKVETDSVDKNATEFLLNEDIPEKVKAVLEIKSELGKSSVTKFTAILDKIDTDNRIKNWSVYHGAATGRWSAQGLQFHNMPRNAYTPETIDSLLPLFESEDTDTIQLLYDEVFPAASKCIRGIIKAPKGKEFYCADFSSIEGRGLAYLSGEQWVVDAYAKNTDMYKFAASDIFGVAYDKVTKPQRQIGKVAELALGYGGGIGAFVSMAKNYEVDLGTLPGLILPTASDYEVEKSTYIAEMFFSKNTSDITTDTAVACDIIKSRWRAARPNITAFWRQIERVVKEAIKNPGEVFSYNGIKYTKSNDFLKCLMPSGRVMRYYQPMVMNDTENKEYISYMGMKIVDGKTTRQWARVKTYSGRLVENIVQGFCRDLLAEMITRCEKHGYPVVIHVHDEVVVEVDPAKKDYDEFISLTKIIPTWAAGMPIDVSGWRGERYRK